MEAINVRVVKEPRGMMRIIQFVFAILAFSTTTSFETVSQILVACPNSPQSTINYAVEYPFKFENQKVTERFNCTKNVPRFTQKFPMEFASSAQFFVATGVLCFLYSAGSLAFYLFQDKKYETNPLLPVIDLIATGVLTIFWLAGTLAWAATVSDIKYYTNPTYLAKHINICKDPVAVCSIQQLGKWASLNISLIFGFSNIGLWAMSMWFVFKETSLHQRASGAMPPGGPGQFGGPGYGDPSMGQQQFPQQQQFPPQQQTQFPPQQQYAAAGY